MKVSGIITKDDIDLLNLVVLSCFSVREEAGVLKLFFYNPENTDKLNPLFSYEIVPAANADYAGELIPVLLEDLSKTVYTLYQAYSEKSDWDIIQKVLNIVNGAAQSTSKRLLSNKEFKIMTDKIYSVDEMEWYP